MKMSPGNARRAAIGTRVDSILRMKAFGLVLLIAVFASSCASSDLRCDASERRGVVESLYFGSAKPDGVVTSAEWQAFVEREIAPRFPDGFSVWPAEGEWRNADGSIVRENSWVLQVVSFDPSAAESLRSIVEAYRKQFRQEAVMRVHYPGCISFNEQQR